MYSGEHEEDWEPPPWLRGEFENEEDELKGGDDKGPKEVDPDAAQ